MSGQEGRKNEQMRQRARIYVKVNSDCDATGYMQPCSITWRDGRRFFIDAVKEHRPASVYRKGAEGSCYTVMIRGEEKHLFCEWVDSVFSNRMMRWYVEASEPEST